MKTLQTIEQYIKEHPFQSDKKIAKRLKIDRERVKEIRSYFGQNTGHPKVSPPPFIKSMQRRKTLADFGNKVKILLDFPFLRGKATYLNIFLLALLVRLIYMIFLKKQPMLSVPLLDAENYVLWAERILKEGPIGDKIFFAEPLYAYLLALFLRIFANGEVIMITLQTILGSLLPLVVAKLGERLFNRQIAIISALVTALYGPFVFYENLLLKTSLETFLLTLFVLAVLYVFETAKIWRYFGCGLFLGLIVTLKGNTLIVLPLVVYFIFKLTQWSRRIKMILTGAFMIGFFLAVFPVTLRNYLVGKDFVLTNYSIGMFIYQGNWWDADGSLLQPPFSRPVPKYEETDFYKMAEAYVGRPLKPSETTGFWMGKTLSEISADPGRWLYLTGKKFLLLTTRVELSDNYDYALYKKFIPFLDFLPDFWPVASFALTAIVLLLFSKDLRWTLGESKNGQNWILDKGKKLILSLLAGYGLLMLSGSLNSRYRQPMIPFLIILAVVSLWYGWRKLKERRYSQLTLMAILSSSFFFLTSVHLSNFDFMTDANFYNNLGSYYVDRKDFAKAQKYFQKAIELDKEYVWAYSNLFNLYLRHGEFVLAKEDLTEQIKLRPDDLGSYYNLKLFNDLQGKPVEFIQNRLDLEEKKTEAEKQNRYDLYFYEYMRYFKRQNYPKSQEYLEKSAEKFNNPENTLLNLAVLKKNLGDKQSAKEILLKIIQKNPNFLAAHYNLANIYFQEKNYTEAAELLQHVYDVVPEYGETWFYLAAAYINSKNYDAATPVVTGFIKRYENDPTKKSQVEKLKSLLVPNTK